MRRGRREGVEDGAEASDGGGLIQNLFHTYKRVNTFSNDELLPRVFSMNIYSVIVLDTKLTVSFIFSRVCLQNALGMCNSLQYKVLPIIK